ncbi:MAG: YitT family protein, partial [Spirochaetota bacterium]
DEAAERIKDRIYTELDRGATYFQGMGAYSHLPKTILYVTFHIRQTSRLKRLVLEEDPNVFMVMHDVHDVIGYGFRTRGLEM